MFALPYIVHDQDNARGMLIIAKTEAGADVTLTSAPNGTTALVLEGVGEEPGFNPPVEKVVGPDGKLPVGPYVPSLSHTLMGCSCTHTQGETQSNFP